MNLLASGGAVGVDVAFFVILLLGILVGVRCGFIKSVCKIAGTIFSVVVAFTFCVSFQNLLEKWFSLTTALCNAIHNDTIAKILAVVISFVTLIILVKLIAWGLGTLGSALVDHFKPFRVINRVLGGVLGLLEAVMLIILILALCSVLPVPSLHEFLESCTVTGSVYRWVSAELLYLLQHAQEIVPPLVPPADTEAVFRLIVK